MDLPQLARGVKGSNPNKNVEVTVREKAARVCLAERPLRDELPTWEVRFRSSPPMAKRRAAYVCSQQRKTAPVGVRDAMLRARGSLFPKRRAAPDHPLPQIFGNYSSENSTAPSKNRVRPETGQYSVAVKMASGLPSAASMFVCLTSIRLPQ